MEKSSQPTRFTTQIAASPSRNIFPSGTRRGKSQQRKSSAGNCCRRFAMSCRWVYSPSRTTPQRFCGWPGHSYCAEHHRQLDAMEQADKDWDDMLATHEAVCEELRRKTRGSSAFTAAIAAPMNRIQRSRKQLQISRERSARVPSRRSCFGSNQAPVSIPRRVKMSAKQTVGTARLGISS